MSCPHIAWAFHVSRRYHLKANTRLVLIALSEHANGSKVCWPSIAALCEDTGLCRRAVQYAIRELASADDGHPALIVVENRPRQVCEYRILRENTDRPEREHRVSKGASRAPQKAGRAPVAAPIDGAQDTPTPVQVVHRAPDAPLKPDLRVHGSLFDGAPHAHGIPQVTPKGRKEEELRSPSLRARRGKIPLPDEWYPNRKATDLAASLGLSPERLLEEAEQMRGWARFNAKTGVDWDARFANWLRTAAERSGTRPGQVIQLDPRRASAAAIDLANARNIGERMKEVERRHMAGEGIF